MFDLATKRVGNFCDVKALIFWNYLCLAEVRDAGSARASRRCFLDSFWAHTRADLEQPIQAHCGGKLPLEQLYKKNQDINKQDTASRNNQLKRKTNARKLRAKHKHNKHPTNYIIQETINQKLHNKNAIENIKQKQQTNQKKTNNKQ